MSSAIASKVIRALVHQLIRMRLYMCENMQECTWTDESELYIFCRFCDAVFVKQKLRLFSPIEHQNMINLLRKEFRRLSYICRFIYCEMQKSGCSPDQPICGRQLKNDISSALISKLEISRFSFMRSILDAFGITEIFCWTRN